MIPRRLSYFRAFLQSYTWRARGPLVRWRRNNINHDTHLQVQFCREMRRFSWRTITPSASGVAIHENTVRLQPCCRVGELCVDRVASSRIRVAGRVPNARPYGRRGRLFIGSHVVLEALDSKRMLSDFVNDVCDHKQTGALVRCGGSADSPTMPCWRRLSRADQASQAAPARY
jgi:hypothetical protein